MMRTKRTFKKAIIFVILVTLIVGGFIAIYMLAINPMKAVYEAQLDHAKTTLAENTKSVYIATRDIEAGEKLQADNISQIEALMSLDSQILISAEDIGSVVAVDIAANNLVTKSMILSKEYDDSLRETQFDVIVLNSNLRDGDVVDVRIRFQNGEDYVVLAQKQLFHLSLPNAVCYMHLTEDELQLMASAIVDAGCYEAVLYTVKYVASNVQSASQITYQPSEAVLEVMKNNPNAVKDATLKLSVEARKEMEKRFSFYSQEDNSVVENSINISNTKEMPDISHSGNMQGTYTDNADATNN